MALVVYDRVQETSTSTGTGAVTLLGAVAGFQSFAVVGNGNTTFYCIADQGGGTNWEVGIGTYSTTGPSLARTTVLASSNSGSLVNFTAGTKSVFVTYPSEKSVNLDASGNVTALGTITSGVWNGTTIPVAYGGTGVTASSGANSVVLRDANQNVTANNFLSGYNVITASGGTTVLTVASAYYQRISGSTTQTIQLPNATTLVNGQGFTFDNDSSGTVTIVDNASGVVDTIPSGAYGYIFVEDNSTSAGSWGKYALLPASYDFSTTTANFGTATITNATYNGNTIQPAYGGTGITTFSAANNALYSTSSSALTAGTLPVLAGGTGVTTSTGSGSVVLSTSPTLVTPLLGTPTSGNLANCTGYPAGSISGTINLATQVTGTLPVANGGSGATTLTGYVYGNGTSAMTASTTIPGSAISGNISGNAANVTGTVAIANGGTGQTTASAGFNALSPITTTGDLIVGNGVNSATRLGIGTTGQVLTSNGTTATWSSPSTGAGTITRTDFTATAGQTIFTVSYTVGLIDVYQNGAKLATTDFTATNGTSFTLATGAAAGDLIQAVVFSSLNIYATITTDVFSGNGTTTAFTMSVAPSSSGATLVTISGVVQDPSTYTVAGTTLTFSTAPPAGTNNITARYLGVPSVTTVGSFSGGTTGLTPSSATSGAVTLGGVLNVTNGGTGQSSFTAGQIHYGSFSTSSNLFYDSANNRLGLGTNTPAVNLDVVSPNNGATAWAWFHGNTGGALPSSSVNSGLLLGGNYSAGNSESNIMWGTGYNSSTQYLAFSTWNNSTNTVTERVRFDSSGNVGIGTTSSGNRLEVSNGAADVAVLVKATGANYATYRMQNNARDYSMQIRTDQSNAWTLRDETAGANRLLVDTSGNFLFNSGYGSVATAYGCRAWLNMNASTPGITASGNISSVSRNATGQFSATFTNAMPDANYAVVGTASNAGGTIDNVVTMNCWGTTAKAPTTTTFYWTVDSPTVGGQNPGYVYFAVFR